MVTGEEHRQVCGAGLGVSLQRLCYQMWFLSFQTSCSSCEPQVEPGVGLGVLPGVQAHLLQGCSGKPGQHQE